MLWCHQQQLQQLAEVSNFYNCAYQHFVLHQQNRNTDRFCDVHIIFVIIPIRFLLVLCIQFQSLTQEEFFPTGAINGFFHRKP